MVWTYAPVECVASFVSFRNSCTSATSFTSGTLTFFFQAEDGIRDVAVTGVQTCALPISGRSGRYARKIMTRMRRHLGKQRHQLVSLGEFCAYMGLQIGRASCRERV